MRRQARVCAMQVLYQMDLLRALRGGEAAAGRALQHHLEHFEELAPPEQEFARRLVAGVARELTALDAALAAASHHWKLTRMGRVDRSLLRLAAFEILHCADIPRKASINEAIEIAKAYGSQESAAFVNGVLDQLFPAVDAAALAPPAAVAAAAGSREPAR